MLSITLFSGLSILQNGKIPAFINDLEDQIFSMAETNSESIRNLQIGLDWLGLYTVSNRIYNLPKVKLNDLDKKKCWTHGQRVCGSNSKTAEKKLKAKS